MSLLRDRVTRDITASAPLLLVAAVRTHFPCQTRALGSESFQLMAACSLLSPVLLVPLGSVELELGKLRSSFTLDRPFRTSVQRL